MIWESRVKIPTPLCAIHGCLRRVGSRRKSWEQFEMLEDTAMQALQQFQERYLSKPKYRRVIDNPNRATKRRH